MACAISSTWVSNAKRPVSRNCTIAFGLFRPKASTLRAGRSTRLLAGLRKITSLGICHLHRFR